MRIKNEDTQKTEEQARQLRSELEQLKREVSEVRRQGYYTKSVESIIFGIWPKIRMFNATGKDEDYSKVKTLFQQVHAEIEKAKTGGDNPYLKKEGEDQK